VECGHREEQSTAIVNSARESGWKNNASYGGAAKLLQKTRGLMARLGQQNSVDQLTAILANHKPRRKFIKLLDKLGL
jgi:uncharacterized Zn finger protein